MRHAQPHNKTPGAWLGLTVVDDLLRHGRSTAMNRAFVSESSGWYFCHSHRESCAYADERGQCIFGRCKLDRQREEASRAEAGHPTPSEPVPSEG
jgi:hypothetical protein